MAYIVLGFAAIQPFRLLRERTMLHGRHTGTANRRFGTISSCLPRCVHVPTAKVLRGYAFSAYLVLVPPKDYPTSVSSKIYKPCVNVKHYELN